MLHTTRRAGAQETSPSSSITIVETPSFNVAGHAARDNWICAVLRDHDLTPTALKVAVRLGIFFNCKTGRCDPGYPKIAAELNISLRSVMRAVATLEERGWLAVGAPCRHLNRKFSLLMPTVEVPLADTSRTRVLSPLKQKLEVTGSASRGDKNSSLEVTPRCHTEPDEPENLIEAGLTTRRLVDRVILTEPETSDDAPLNPAVTTSDVSPSAPDGAENHDVHRRLAPIESKELGTAANANAPRPPDGAGKTEPLDDERLEPAAPSTDATVDDAGGGDRPDIETHQQPALADCDAVSAASKSLSGFERLCFVYPNQDEDDFIDARPAFDAALHEGATIDMLAEAADIYRRHSAFDDLEPYEHLPLAEFLRAGHWRDKCNALIHAHLT